MPKVVVVGGYLKPSTTLVAIGEAAGDGRTGQALFLVRCAATSRNHVDRWSFVLLRHRIVRCHTGQSGATSDSPVPL
jgi:hypothetical protein